MARDDDNHPTNGNGNGNGAGGTNLRQEPTFGRFVDDDDYEEPDRDANHTSDYLTESAARDADYDDDYPEDDESDLFEDEDEGAPDDDADEPDEQEADDDEWLEDDEYPDEDEERTRNWPASLIAVAVVALVLLAAGGYGVMQQRAATEDELRDLRAKLATASVPREGGAGLPALEELQLAYDKLNTEAEALRLENRSLTDTVAGLEAQLGNRQQAAPTPAATVAEPAKPAQATVAQPEPKPAQAIATAPPAAAAPAPAPAAKPAPAPAPKPAPAPSASKPAAANPASTAATGPWFVNFGSYATRAMAESWAARLKPATGKVIIMPTTSNGKTLYRLRVIGLADSNSAKQVARKLETDLRVATLWVGKE